MSEAGGSFVTITQNRLTDETWFQRFHRRASIQPIQSAIPDSTGIVLSMDLPLVASKRCATGSSRIRERRNRTGLPYVR